LKRAYAPQTEYQNSTAAAACNFVVEAGISVTKSSADHETENVSSCCAYRQNPLHTSA